jgi:asparagine synthase (glutamine-hydrolysing)
LDAVRAMNAAQVHRGPDDEGVYVDPAGDVGLGARRLSIIDLEHGHQPISNEDGTVWAVLNGEIYNSPALQERLKSAGHTFRSRSDTETLVHLYEEYGEEMVHALTGMFAFALWDERARRLLLARDRFGEKPLFFQDAPTGLTFASELSALARALPSTPDLDLDALDAYFVLGYVPGPATILEGVRQVPPGCILTWSAARPQADVRRYWRARRAVSSHREPDADLVAETRRLIEKSIRQVLVSDVPVGVLLSGGLDSTLVTAMISKVSPAPVTTFTVGYDVGDVSELRAAQTTSAHLGTSHHAVVMGDDDVALRVPAVLSRLDQPLADPAVVPLHAVSELARRHVPVVISGEGADELFGGYPRYRWLIHSTQVKTVLPDALAYRTARLLARPRLGEGAARLSRVVAPQATLDRHLDWVTAGRRHLRSAMYGERMHSRSTGTVAFDSLMPHLDGFVGELGADAFMQLDQRHWLPDDVLVKSDRAGMLNSLEIRTPYLTTEIAEFANSVQARTHLGNFGKKLLREVAGEVYPMPRTRWRKRAFRVPGQHWLGGPLKPLLERQLVTGRLVTDGYVDGRYAQTMMREHFAGADRTAVLWPMLAFGLWLDAQLDDRARA